MADPTVQRPKVQQPKPVALPARSGPASILVSPRQKGNPILNSVRNVPWEYSDIPADYVLGATTCALFLSLKYHRLHPEYIYSRIRALAGKYNLRILLTMVDIDNHEEALKELSKTSLINNVTLILCWSAQEAGRYLELFKTYEHAAPTSIRAPQASNYSEKMVEFITTPRSINKTDAVSLVSNFGSLRTAINAQPEEVALVAGWGEKKVKKWCSTVREPFRITKAAKRDSPDPRVAARLGVGAPVPVDQDLPAPAPGRNQDAEERPSTRITEDLPLADPGDDEEEALRELELAEAVKSSKKPAEPANACTDKPSDTASTLNKRKAQDEPLSEGIQAALARFRQGS
ncbi:restriction endonuclease type II-like protein [Macrophomina phaseolina]|uniref:Restriction endonuclease type II-like protein n=1 Tax=Macrophomina phaseolina TaxID=35725 RepID=A0ABQ8FUT0_9PEZI|nr:restriction endonuclease type II-like protein [Macrophomina phaseolina]